MHCCFLLSVEQALFRLLVEEVDLLHVDRVCRFHSVDEVNIRIDSCRALLAVDVSVEVALGSEQLAHFDPAPESEAIR